MRLEKQPGNNKLTPPGPAGKTQWHKISEPANKIFHAFCFWHDTLAFYVQNEPISTAQTDFRELGWRLDKIAKA